MMHNVYLTYYEEYLHSDVADSGAACQVIVPDEAHIVWDSDSHVKGGEQDQPVPACLEGAVVEQDELGFLSVGYLIFRKRWRVPEHVLAG